MKKVATLFWLLLITPFTAVAQNQDVALIAVECVAVKGLCEQQNLVRFRFRNGVLVSQDVILNTKTVRVRFALNDNQLYRNRYVINRSADIVDVQNKQVLHEGDGEYVATEGDRIIQRLDSSRTKGYFYYDLKTDRYRRLSRFMKWELPGLLSPDQTKSVEGDGDSIWLHRLGRPKKLLGSGFSVQAEIYVSFFARPPVFWLDDTRILTQKNNGEVVSLQLDGTVTPIVKIPINEPNDAEPSFHRDLDGRIIYRVSGRRFVINVDEKSYSAHEWSTLGFGFDAENERNASYGHVVRYRGKEIGRLWATVWGAPTIDGHVAFLYGDVGSNLGYPKGIQVWSSVSNSWTKINPKWVTHVIGWVRE